MVKATQNVFLGLLVMGSVNLYAATVIVCPNEITTAEELVSELRGYQTHVEKGGHFWAGVSVFDGDRKDNAELAPSSSTKTSDTYELDKPGLISLQCNYQNSGFSLVKTVEAKRCVVEKDATKLGNHGPIPTAVRCE